MAVAICSPRLAGRNGVHRVAHHHQHLEGHHDLVIFHEITGEEEDALCGHGMCPVLRGLGAL
jgi:hypothetical protein